jgi:demethylmenaquinone methyltransferase / 2-methoxy-6-polyprenyl-1,4-benzoquinol methylase
VDVIESRRQPNRFAQRLFSGLPGRYDRLAEVLSLGQNGRWRSAMVDAVEAAEPLGTVLDVATGTCGVAIQLAGRTGADVVGIDLTEAMLRVGQQRVQASAEANKIRLVAGRGEELPFADDTFDALTFTYLLRYVSDPAATIAELARVTKPGGVVANLEFCVPSNPVWRGLWVLYTRMVLPVAGYLTGGQEWRKVGSFLGPSSSEHYRRYPLAWHVKAWQDAGIDEVGVRTMSLGGGVVMWGRKTRGKA